MTDRERISNLEDVNRQLRETVAQLQIEYRELEMRVEKLYEERKHERIEARRNRDY